VTRGLWWLLWRDTIGAGRGIAARTLRPMPILLALGFLLLAGLLAYATRGQPGISLAGARQIGAPVLAMVVLLGVFSPHGLFFRPAEIDWLFPAPVSRRSLALFNILVRARTAVLSGLVLPMFVSWRGNDPLFTFLGYTLVLPWSVPGSRRGPLFPFVMSWESRSFPYRSGQSRSSCARIRATSQAS